jgi:hypothetical protein
MSIFDKKKTRRYIEAAVCPSNNGIGPTWYNPNLYPGDREMAQLVPPEQLRDSHRSVAYFNPEKDSIVAIEYLRKGWTFFKEYTKEETFKICSSAHKNLSDSYCYCDDVTYVIKPRVYWVLYKDI